MGSTSNPKLYRFIQSPAVALDLDLARALPYQYDKLTDSVAQIRLLELLPGKNLENIKCRLIHVDRSAAAGTYEPLSYVWGDQSTTIPIYVNDNKTMSIGVNLHAALARLRRPDVSRMLWADALCINQGDILEKNMQVQLMRSVYENGTQTVVWLGEEDDPYLTPAAFRIWEFANEFADAHPGEKFNLREWKKFQRLGRDEPEYRYFGLEYLWSSADEGFAEDAIHSVLMRDWFYRVWIVQEIAVSKQALLMCGPNTILWDRLQRAHEASFMSRDVNALAQLIDQRKKYLQSVPEDLSAKIWNVAAPAEATDPRDRVYAILGLMANPRAIDVPVTVDYSLPAEVLFRDLTRRHLELSRDVGLLACSVGCRDQGGEDVSFKGPAAVARDENREDREPMPSWAWRPVETGFDLHVKELFAWDPNGDNFGGFQASGPPTDAADGMVFDDDDEEKNHLLGLMGYEFDQITETGPAVDPANSGMQFDYLWASAAYAYMQWRQMATGCRVTTGKESDNVQQQRGQEEQKYVGTDESRLEAFRKVIQPVPTTPKGNLPDDELAALFRRFDAFMLQYFSFLENDRPPKKKEKWWSKRPQPRQQQKDEQQQHSQEQKMSGGLIARWSMQVQRLAWMHKFNSGDVRVVDSLFRIFRAINRRFCMTARGYMALAPRSTMVGDSVVLLRGARAPFVLRKAQAVSCEGTGRVGAAGDVSNRWTIVGDCRVHGIMHGEAWDEQRCERMWIV